jgi:FHS family glucose/mannose:H+ symporter-like MFS transporter
MPTTEPSQSAASAKALNLAAYASFVPIGIVTVLLGPLLPSLSARWSLNYSQAGALFPAQFMASTVAVMVSGVLSARWGYRFAIKAGLLLTGVSLALMFSGPRVLGIICIAGYGAGFGLAVPPSNLLVAEVNPERRSAALNTLNFCWSVGAVSCPFLVAAAANSHRVPLFLLLVAALSIAVAIGIAAMPKNIVEPAQSGNIEADKAPRIDWRQAAVFVVAALFFIYVGTETAFGGWVASYAQSLGSIAPALSVMMGSFFYGSLTVGRLFAPMALRAIDEIKLAQIGTLMAAAGMAGLLFSHSALAIAGSSCIAGMGLSSVYPITISLLAREFGAGASRVASVMFTVANLGGSSLPWLVGVSSGRFGSLRVGMAVPLIGSIALFLLYLRDWTPVQPKQAA